jgi:hypothetical protein
LDNFSQFIFILIIASLLMIVGLIIYYVPKINQKVKEKIVQAFRNMKWNGIIRTLTVSYLKIAIYVSLKI